MAKSRKIGIIGVGKMGTALVVGLLKAGLIQKSDLYASDISTQRCYNISKTYGIKCFSDNKAVVEKSDIIIIAVEPRHVKTVLEDIREGLTNKLLVSIAAGVTIDFLNQNLKKNIPIVRAMPNNPCMVGEGMTVLTSSYKTSEEEVRVVEEIFSSVGRVMLLDETFFDAVTGISGSGPAFIYLAIEGLVEGAIGAGLPEDTAITLAAQTVLGVGRTILETGIHPQSLKGMLTTPEGTTIEGLKVLERGNVKTLFARAVRRAIKRAKELKNVKSAKR